MSSFISSYIRWFSEIGLGDVSSVGGKNASLGEMYRELVPNGVRVPNGFAITAEAYYHLLEVNDLEGKIRDLLKGIDTQNNDLLRERGRLIRQASRAVLRGLRRLLDWLK